VSPDRGKLTPSSLRRVGRCFGWDVVEGGAGWYWWLALDAGVEVGEESVEVGDGPGVKVGKVEWFAFLGAAGGLSRFVAARSSVAGLAGGVGD
jgi:hypothetical protein